MKRSRVREAAGRVVPIRFSSESRPPRLRRSAWFHCRHPRAKYADRAKLWRSASGADPLPRGGLQRLKWLPGRPMRMPHIGDSILRSTCPAYCPCSETQQEHGGYIKLRKGEAAW
jgi:hypothetical protein